MEEKSFMETINERSILSGIQDVKNIGENGRKVLMKRFKELEDDLIANAKTSHNIASAAVGLADIFKNIDDALGYKLEKIKTEWQERTHERRFLDVGEIEK